MFYIDALLCLPLKCIFGWKFNILGYLENFLKSFKKLPSSASHYLQNTFPMDNKVKITR